MIDMSYNTKEYPKLNPYGEESVKMPSEYMPPTRTDSAHQQASTEPGDGKRVDANRVSVKDQIKGYAKVAQGTITGNQDTKQLGQQILHGEHNLTSPSQ